MLTLNRRQLALQFFGLSLAIFTVATLVGAAAIGMSQLANKDHSATMPFAFWISTALLAAGSVTLQQAAWNVRVQRLDQFRSSLTWSLIFGTLFVAAQSAGLWRLVHNQIPAQSSQPESAETGANAFVVMVAGMHGVHIVVALLFVVWVTVNAYAHRYDHEYSSSVTFCAWFWHVLGIVWLAILTLFAAGAITGFEGMSVPDPQSIAFRSAR